MEQPICLFQTSSTMSIVSCQGSSVIIRIPGPARRRGICGTAIRSRCRCAVVGTTAGCRCRCSSSRCGRRVSPTTLPRARRGCTDRRRGGSRVGTGCGGVQCRRCRGSQVATRGRSIVRRPACSGCVTPRIAATGARRRGRDSVGRRLAAPSVSAATARAAAKTAVCRCLGAVAESIRGRCLGTRRPGWSSRAAAICGCATIRSGSSICSSVAVVGIDGTRTVSCAPGRRS